jgi:RND family efflux transporter MFP subunit
MRYLPTRSNFSSVWSYLKKNKKISVPLLILVIGIILVFRPHKAVVIDTEKVSRGDVVVSISGTGTAVSETAVNLSFLTSGKLTYLGVKEGDTVMPQQTIATLDVRSTQKSLEGALRDYAKQRNTFEQTKQNNNNATPDTAANDQVRRVLENNQYDLEKAVISVELQDLAKQNSVLTTPIGGVVTRADVQSGGVNVSPTTTFTIADPDHLQFDIDVDEADIGKISLVDSIKAHLDAFPEQTLTLTISNIDFASHATSTGGTVYTIHAALPDNSDRRYRAGMSGDADIILDQRTNVIKIPLSAVVKDNTVFVKDGNSFVKRQVVLGLKNDTDVQIISGLTDGDVIATQPDQVMVKK